MTQLFETTTYLSLLLATSIDHLKAGGIAWQSQRNKKPNQFTYFKGYWSLLNLCPTTMAGTTPMWKKFSRCKVTRCQI